MALSLQHQRFAEEYVVDLHAANAAIRAGYSERTADRQGSRLLRNAAIQAEIARLNAERSLRTEITADRVLVELARIAFADRRALFSWGPGGVQIKDSDSLSADAAALVEEVSQTITEAGGTVRVKTASKTEALKMLGQHLGIFLDRIEVSQRTKLIITEEIVDADDSQPPNNAPAQSPG